jgi:phosphoethanolamine N-methyltransferase
VTAREDGVNEVPHDYDDSMLELLQTMWGEGFLSPGGPDAVREILHDIDLVGCDALDIGCGLGGLDQVIIELGAAHVTAVDVDEHLIELATQRRDAAGLSDRISCAVIAPEAPLPFGDSSFDLVFTKDAWLHVIDKAALVSEVFRVLRPGGRLAGGDWLKGPLPFSDDMRYFVELEGIPYHPATIAEYQRLYSAAGFADVRLLDTTEWYRDLAREEYLRLQGELHHVMTRRLGAPTRDHFIEDWRMLVVVLERGELRPSRFWARKPRSAALRR